jgi:hypothetical protein
MTTATITRIRMYNASLKFAFEVDSDQVKLHEKKMELVRKALEVKAKGDIAAEMEIAGKIITLNRRIRKNVSFPQD